jgi:heat shock protein HtpX
MIGALRSLQRVYGLPAEAEGSPAFQTMKISGKAGGLLALLSTHPPLEERIARLRGRRVSTVQGPPASGRPDRQDQARAMWDRLSGKE